MLDEIVPEMKYFLKQYKKKHWKECLECCLVYGAKRISRRYPFGLTVEQLSKLAGRSRKRGNATERNRRKRENKLTSFTSPVTKSTRKSSRNSQEKRSAPILKIPDMIKEPNTCSLEDAKNYIKTFRGFHPNSSVQSIEVMKIADDFLKNPFTSYLIQSPGNKVGSNQGIR